jgi:hypothetical protein
LGLCFLSLCASTRSSGFSGLFFKLNHEVEEDLEVEFIVRKRVTIGKIWKRREKLLFLVRAS